MRMGGRGLALRQVCLHLCRFGFMVCHTRREASASLALWSCGEAPLDHLHLGIQLRRPGDLATQVIKNGRRKLVLGRRKRADGLTGWRAGGLMRRGSSTVCRHRNRPRGALQMDCTLQPAPAAAVAPRPLLTSPDLISPRPRPRPRPARASPIMSFPGGPAQGVGELEYSVQTKFDDPIHTLTQRVQGPEH